MNIVKTGIATAIIIGAISGCEQSASDLSRAADKPESELAMQSYALGHNMGGSLKAAGIEIESAYFNAGFYDAAVGSQLMSQEEIQTELKIPTIGIGASKYCDGQILVIDDILGLTESKMKFVKIAAHFKLSFQCKIYQR